MVPMYLMNPIPMEECHKSPPERISRLFWDQRNNLGFLGSSNL
jgi:hypothetical protein